MTFKIRVQLKEKPVKVDHGFPGSKCDWVFENPVAIPKKKTKPIKPWALGNLPKSDWLLS